MPTERVYVLDRIEGATAVLVDDAGATLDVPVRSLPSGVREGAVLRVSLRADGAPDWSTARVDHAEAARRRAEGEERLKRLRKRDPGGDIKL